MTWQVAGSYSELDFDSHFSARCTLCIYDWREYGFETFECPTCTKTMSVRQHVADLDGVRRDQFSCTVNGKFGLTKEVKFTTTTVNTSPVVKCDNGHTRAMHSVDILKQLPLDLQQEVYPCDLPYAVGMQMHFARDVTDVAEALYAESETSIARLTSAIDEGLAKHYESLSERYHRARAAYLDGLTPQAAAMEAARLPCVNESMRKQLYGVGPSEKALGDRVEAKMIGDAAERTDELRSLEAPEGGLLHACADDNDPVAKALQVAGSYECPPHLQPNLGLSHHPQGRWCVSPESKSETDIKTSSRTCHHLPCPPGVAERKGGCMGRQHPLAPNPCAHHPLEIPKGSHPMAPSRWRLTTSLAPPRAVVR